MSLNTIYGTAVILVKGEEVYLCRRTEKVLFPKKWQFINARLKHDEQSVDASLRAIEEQTMLTIKKERLWFIDNLIIDSANEFYYVYAVNLKPEEIPLNTCDRWRGDWKSFPLNKSVVLDVVPGIRKILIRLYSSHLKFKKLNEAKQQNHETRLTDEHIRQQLSQGEQLHLSKLGPKMTRHYGTHEFDGMGV